MLSKPDAGWTTITIGSFSDRASYLTNIPTDFLYSMIRWYDNPTTPFCVYIDCEGWEHILVMEGYTLYVISETDSTKLQTIEIDKDSLALELVADIENNLYDWADWEPYSENVESNAKVLLALCDELKNKVAEKKRMREVWRQDFIRNRDRVLDEMRQNNSENTEE